MRKLTIPEKILVHLYAYRKYGNRYEYPVEMTQPGIAKALGISVTHVPRNVKRLQEQGLVEVRKGHVPGKRKRVTIYTLTPQGSKVAGELVREIEEEEVEMDGGRMSLGEIRKEFGIPLIDLIVKVERGERIEVRRGSRVIFMEESVGYEEFIDREEELSLMKKWCQNGKVLVIKGPRGMGKTVLVREFLNRNDVHRGIVWLHIYPSRSWSSVVEVLKNLFNESSVLNVLRNYPLLLILDNYHDVSDDFVEAMHSLIMEDIGESRIIVTMPSSTPFYNRFYSMEDVREGRVMEIEISALKYEDARKLLPDVREDAFKRIYQITKGNTRILHLLSRGELRAGKDVPLTQETVHLLNYLASKRLK